MFGLRDPDILLYSLKADELETATEILEGVSSGLVSVGSSPISRFFNRRSARSVVPRVKRAMAGLPSSEESNAGVSLHLSVATRSLMLEAIDTTIEVCEIKTANGKIQVLEPEEMSLPLEGLSKVLLFK